jgi:hypothetical protein
MTQNTLAIAGLVLALTTSVHADELTAADIAALPQDRVRTILKECHYPTNFVLQDMCERTQLEALKRIVDRGTYQSGGSNEDERNRILLREKSLKALIERGGIKPEVKR